MRGSEVNINLSEMKEWTSALKSSDTMKIIALEKWGYSDGCRIEKKYVRENGRCMENKTLCDR